MTKIIKFIAITFMLVSCQTVIHSGTSISDKQLETLKNTKFTKNQVSELLGSPNLTPEYSNNVWYYVYRNLTKRAFFNSQIKQQKIVKLTFAGDLLSSVEEFNDLHNKDIEVISEFTRTKGTEMNPVQEYLRNFGRFNKGKKKDPRR